MEIQLQENAIQILMTVQMDIMQILNLIYVSYLKIVKLFQHIFLHKILRSNVLWNVQNQIMVIVNYGCVFLNVIQLILEKIQLAYAFQIALHIPLLLKIKIIYASVDAQTNRLNIMLKI